MNVVTTEQQDIELRAVLMAVGQAMRSGSAISLFIHPQTEAIQDEVHLTLRHPAIDYRASTDGAIQYNMNFKHGVAKTIITLFDVREDPQP